MITREVSVNIPFRRFCISAPLEAFGTLHGLKCFQATVASATQAFGSLRELSLAAPQILREVFPADYQAEWLSLAADSTETRMHLIRACTRDWCDSLWQPARCDGARIAILEKAKVLLPDEYISTKRTLVIQPQAYHTYVHCFVLGDKLHLAVNYGDDPPPSIRADSWVVERSSQSLQRFLGLSPFCERQMIDLWVEDGELPIPIDVQLEFDLLPAGWSYPRPDRKRRSDPGDGGQRVLCYTNR